MDAFFAAVEQRNNPRLLGKPVVIGSSEKRGVVATASYEARKFGVKSAMPGFLAKKLCPACIFISPNFESYKKVSKQIQKIFYEYTDLVEPLSLDEAYLDVTENKKGNPSAIKIALEIKQRIKEETGLTASAGVSFNKFLAKVASDYRKPDGITLIDQDHSIAFLENLKIEKFYGVGKVTAKKMHSLKIFKGIDIKNKSLEFLTQNFSKAGKYYYDIVRGVDNRTVNPARIRKSLGVETTFEKDLTNPDMILNKLLELSNTTYQKLLKQKITGKTITLKIKFSDFKQITISKTENNPVVDANQLYQKIRTLYLKQVFTKPIRLLGVILSKLETIKT
jgi:DNA polymerase-4